MVGSSLKPQALRGSRLVDLPRRHETCGTALLEREPECAPRLCKQDLKEPERFHQRLVDWLMKQR